MVDLLKQAGCLAPNRSLHLLTISQGNMVLHKLAIIVCGGTWLFARVIYGPAYIHCSFNEPVLHGT
jgi:hypothetical protein